jgi:hypothetical protein
MVMAGNADIVGQAPDVGAPNDTRRTEEFGYARSSKLLASALREILTFEQDDLNAPTVLIVEFAAIHTRR